MKWNFPKMAYAPTLAGAAAAAVLAGLPLMAPGSEATAQTRQQLIIDRLSNETARAAMQKALSEGAPALPEGFLLPSVEPSPDKSFKPVTMTQSTDPAKAANANQASPMMAPKVRILGGAEVSDFKGKVELLEVVPGHLIVRIPGKGNTAIEINLAGTRTSGSQTGPAPARRLLATSDPNQPATPQPGEIEYEDTISQGLSAKKVVVLKQENALTFLQIREGSAKPYRRTFEDIGLTVSQQAPAGGEPASVVVELGGASATLTAGKSARLDAAGRPVEVQLLRNFYTPEQELGGYQEGDPYFISLVVTPVN